MNTFLQLAKFMGKQYITQNSKKEKYVNENILKLNSEKSFVTLASLKSRILKLASRGIFKICLLDNFIYFLNPPDSQHLYIKLSVNNFPNIFVRKDSYIFCLYELLEKEKYNPQLEFENNSIKLIVKWN